MAGALLRAARLGSSWVPERPAPSQAARGPALEHVSQEDEPAAELAAGPPGWRRIQTVPKPCPPSAELSARPNKPAHGVIPCPVRGRFWIGCSSPLSKVGPLEPISNQRREGPLDGACYSGNPPLQPTGS